MQRETDWIAFALERNPAKTRAGLARALNIDKSGVTRLLQGERRLKFEEAQKAAAYLGVSPGGGGLAEDATEFAGEPDDMRLAPLCRIESADGGFWRLYRDEIIDRKARAPQFAGAPQVFGFYIPDDAMAPRFRLGETAWVNPARPAGLMDDALLFPRGDTDPAAVFLCALDDVSDVAFTGLQFGTGYRREFPRTLWHAFHVYGRL